jgi:hypothetical protein
VPVWIERMVDYIGERRRREAKRKKLGDLFCFAGVRLGREGWRRMGERVLVVKVGAISSFAAVVVVVREVRL